MKFKVGDVINHKKVGGTSVMCIDIQDERSLFLRMDVDHKFFMDNNWVDEQFELDKYYIWNNEIK